MDHAMTWAGPMRLCARRIAMRRITIQVWDSLEQAQAWRKSADYKAARMIGDKYATYRAFAVEGVAK